MGLACRSRDVLEARVEVIAVGLLMWLMRIKNKVGVFIRDPRRTVIAEDCDLVEITRSSLMGRGRLLRDEKVVFTIHEISEKVNTQCREWMC